MQKIRENAWFQGALLSKSSSFKLASENNLNIGEDGVLMLINQDCDILHRSYENEPYAEFILIEKISEKALYRKDFENGRNPRVLHFQVSDNYYKIHHHNRLAINRNILENEKPSNEINLDASLLILIPRWVGKKYFRLALPDNFESRITDKNRKKITNIIAENADDIEEIYIRLNTRAELNNSDENYKVILLATISNSGVELAEIQEVIDKIAAHLNECPGIQVIESKAEYDEKISLANVKEMDEWDCYNYLSNSVEE